MLARVGGSVLGAGKQDAAQAVLLTGIGGAARSVRVNDAGTDALALARGRPPQEVIAAEIEAFRPGLGDEAFPELFGRHPAGSRIICAGGTMRRQRPHGTGWIGGVSPVCSVFRHTHVRPTP